MFVLLATVCWGFENNCTRNISSKNTYEIVILKDIFSGLGSLIIALIKHERMPRLTYIAVAPFIGVFLSFVFLRERLTGMYLIALAVMVAGTALVVADTLIRQHSHLHQHTFTHTHDGSTHTHTITHSHEHSHYLSDGKHGHHHSKEELAKEAAR